MADNRPYHSKVAERAGQGMRAGAWIGGIVGAVVAITGAVAVPGLSALVAAPFIGLAWMGAGALTGALGGMMFGAVRHSPLFDRRQPENDRLQDLAALQERVQNAIVPEAPLPERSTPGQQNRRFTEMIERERAMRATERAR